MDSRQRLTHDACKFYHVHEGHSPEKMEHLSVRKGHIRRTVVGRAARTSYNSLCASLWANRGEFRGCPVPVLTSRPGNGAVWASWSNGRWRMQPEKRYSGNRLTLRGLDHGIVAMLATQPRLDDVGSIVVFMYTCSPYIRPSTPSIQGARYKKVQPKARWPPGGSIPSCYHWVNLNPLLTRGGTGARSPTH